MLWPLEYARVDALKSTGYVQFLSEWGRTGELFGTAVLWVSALLLATTEELAFRGLIFNYMRREYSFKDALIWNTILFTLAHMNPYNCPVSLVLGLVFTLLYVKSGGLVVPILAHSAYNLSLVYFGEFMH
jgi:membrane protease YdiL (CAAX protease family)